MTVSSPSTPLCDKNVAEFDENSMSVAARMPPVAVAVKAAVRMMTWQREKKERKKERETERKRERETQRIEAREGFANVCIECKSLRPTCGSSACPPISMFLASATMLPAYAQQCGDEHLVLFALFKLQLVTTGVIFSAS